MAQKLASELGIAVGISSGANFLGAVLMQEELGSGSNVVTIFADDNKKYLSTGLMKSEACKSSFISGDIELKSFRALRRSCIMCCNPAECEAVYNPDFINEVDLPTCLIKNQNFCCG
jgi:cysteine synthase A